MGLDFGLCNNPPGLGSGLYNPISNPKSEHSKLSADRLGSRPVCLFSVSCVVLQLAWLVWSTLVALRNDSFFSQHFGRSRRSLDALLVGLSFFASLLPFVIEFEPIFHHSACFRTRQPAQTSHRVLIGRIFFSPHR